MCSYCRADLHICFCINEKFSHVAACLSVTAERMAIEYS